MIIFLGIILIWLVILSVVFYKIYSHYRRLTKGVVSKDLKSILEEILKNSQRESTRIDELFKEIKTLKQENLYNIQKIGLVRFNPFAQIGGDQSFSLAVLDNNNSGFVLSGLHGRETTRLYAKPIKNSKAVGYELSTEEKQAIKNAKKIK